jgi:thioredoxin 1
LIPVAAIPTLIATSFIIEEGTAMGANTHTVTDKSFAADVLQSAEPVVVDFWAPWCGPCKMIAPALEEIATEMAGKIKIAKVNVDENQEIAAQYGIRSIPTLMIFKDGKLAATKVGAGSKSDLSKWITTSA